MPLEQGNRNAFVEYLFGFVEPLIEQDANPNPPTMENKRLLQRYIAIKQIDFPHVDSAKFKTRFDNLLFIAYF